jgi:hypothetical protein
MDRGNWDGPDATPSTPLPMRPIRPHWSSLYAPARGDDNIKAAIVELYAIQANTGGDPTSTLLHNCASSTDKFYLLTSADQMTATFNSIGTNLTKLRVAQ